MKNRFTQFYLLTLTVLIFIAGCAGPEKITSPPPPSIVPTSESAVAKKPFLNPGSLWQDTGPYSHMFVNDKAKRIGDIVTVHIVESSKATNNATTKTDRKSSLDAGIDAFMGMEAPYTDSNNTKYKASRNFNPFSKISGKLDSGFKGTGSTSRSGDLVAYLTAQVIRVLPNGNLQIAGRREVTVNNERQYIQLTGVIRPRDIAPNNVIVSTYIADAQITYTGKGVVHDRQRPGWFVRIMDYVWPF